MRATTKPAHKMHSDVEAAIARAYVEPYFNGYLGYEIPGYEDVQGKDGSILVQTDYEFPSLAQALGWSLTRVQRTARQYSVFNCQEPSEVFVAATGRMWHQHGTRRYSGPARFLQVPSVKGCQHLHTDGAVDCPDCGCTAADFICGAAEFLDNF